MCCPASQIAYTLLHRDNPGQLANTRIYSAGADRERTQVGLGAPLGEERNEEEHECRHDGGYHGVDGLGRTSTAEEPDQPWDGCIGCERQAEAPRVPKRVRVQCSDI